MVKNVITSTTNTTVTFTNLHPNYAFYNIHIQAFNGIYGAEKTLQFNTPITG